MQSNMFERSAEVAPGGMYVFCAGALWIIILAAAHKSGSQDALKLILANALLWLLHWTFKSSQH